MIGKIIVSVRSFFRSGIIRCFWGNKKFAFLAYGMLAILMLVTSANVWGAFYFAELVKTHGDMLQYSTTEGSYLIIVFKVLFIWLAIFATTDALKYFVKSRLAAYWRREARYWYEERAEANPQKVSHIGQRIIDTPKEIVEKMLDVIVDGYRAINSLIFFVPMTIQLSTHFEPVAYAFMQSYLGFGFHIPWLLLWILVIIFLIETGVSHIIGRRLPQLESEKQKAVSLARKIAEKSHSNNHSGRLLPTLADNHLRRRTKLAIKMLFIREKRQINWQSALVLWQITYGILWSIGPMLVIGYFVAVLLTVTLGIMSKAMAALNEVHSSLAVIPNSWPKIMDIRGGLKLLRRIEE